MNRERNQITIRPQQPLSWLVVMALLFAGAALAGNVYGRGSWFFGLLFAATAIGFAWDSIVFDGRRLRRRGPGALLRWAALGQRPSMSVDEVDVIATYAAGAERRDGKPIYQTVISGDGRRWVISSRRRGYHRFAKSLFGAVSPTKLDPRSGELRDHWQERGQLSASNFAAGLPAQTAPQAWRGLANGLALHGQFEAAARYFHLAHRHDPRNAHLLYEMGRFLRLRATTESRLAAGGEQPFKKKKARGKQDATAAYSPLHPARYPRRAEACLRLAGRLAGQDAALLERIGETFFEFHHYRLALRYFERALQADPGRVRAQIGLAEVALWGGQIARVVCFYRAAARLAAESGEAGLARLAEGKADYYERLRDDDKFLGWEMTRLNLLDHLKWARRGAMFIFLAAWLVHLSSYQWAEPLQALSREVSATSAIIWVSTVTATYFFSQRRD